MRRLRQLSIGLLAAIIVASGLSLAPATIAPTTAADAADGADFNPGMIISDAVFYDSKTMTVAQIQSFLNARVPECRSGYTCLKDYRQTTKSQPARSEGCSAYSGQANESAALIIYKVANACGINPRVLIVLLEKEQGLVSDSWPSARQYRSATGYGCPDTADCDANYYGFFNQVYHASWQFKKYRANPGIRNYQAGRTNTIYWHPNASCGTSKVYIENQATAGLYIYTPYRPNTAALRNLYGTGDSCSSYGNRNFWRMFTDWFGSTGTYAVHPSLVALYNSTGGASGSLGSPVAQATLYSGGGVGQRFQRGWGYWHSVTGGFMTKGAIGARYEALKGPAGPLWYPIGKEVAEKGGASQAFQKGMIYWSAATGAQRVFGAIGTFYEDQGGAGGKLGYPTTEEITEKGGASQAFTKGRVYWASATGPQLVAGGILTAYLQSGGPGGALGYPLAPEKAISGGAMQQFQNGAVFWSSSSGGRVLLGEIAAGYQRVGGLTGSLGVPLESTRTYSGGGLGQRFAKGWLYWSSKTGAQKVTGGIGDAYAAAGGPNSGIGYPAGGESTITGGAKQAFSNGAVYWSSATRAQLVRAEIDTGYAAAGGPTGKLGFPVANTVAEANGGFSQRFASGWLFWSADTGAQFISGGIATKYFAYGGSSSRLGFPLEGERSEPGGASQRFQGGSVLWSSSTKGQTVVGGIATVYARLGGPAGAMGYPAEDERSVSGGAAQRYTKGGIYWASGVGSFPVVGGIHDAYVKAGANAGSLGFPQASEVAEPGGASQEFRNGWILWSAPTRAQLMPRQIGEFYYAEGGPATFGYPLAAATKKADGSLEQTFQKGRIRWTSAGGAVRF
ncbi:LGFP repeat-containing protein [Agromyces soli]|uniref:LGFP repeat-containing protein n=1 Tax=Agromyces soli TaxID=659012 RepID=A0ABY4ASR7_9MICO|nr:hypothetical protein [Agromyces soli]UOE26045.1 hypothetical protein MTP13_17310 [Agromyces soli]